MTSVPATRRRVYAIVLLAVGLSACGRILALQGDDAHEPGSGPPPDSGAEPDGLAAEASAADANPEAGPSCASGKHEEDGGCDPLVFVTSATFSGNLGGLDGADLICNRVAGTRYPGATFRAWLSNPVTAPQHVRGLDRPYYGTDGLAVANGWAAFIGGSLLKPIDHSEEGLTISDQSNVWTGTTASGLIAVNSCEGWSEDHIDYAGQVGSSALASGEWCESKDLVNRARVCSSSQHLYCFEAPK
jgi:hypothetical protein